MRTEAYVVLNKSSVPNAKVHRAVDGEVTDSTGGVPENRRLLASTRLLPACGVRLDWTALEYEWSLPTWAGELCKRCFPNGATQVEHSDNPE